MTSGNASDVIILRPGEGRHYDCGPMQSTFLADGQETANRYSASLWSVAAHMPGPGPHRHEDNEEVFFVVRGTMTFLVGTERVDAESGTFLRIPAGVVHDFENKTDAEAVVFNMYLPGGFEEQMPSIVEWFRGQGSQPT